LSVSFHQCSILIHWSTTDAMWRFSSSTSDFPLSVSFHQCSILINSSTTHAMWCFSPSTSGLPCQYHSSNAPYSFIHLTPTLYDVFLPVLPFPCQYHYTNSSYLFIHLPPTLYDVFLPVFQFLLSVSFHQSFIYHRRYMIFFSQYFTFPCQYHSTNAPYSFIHLPSTLHDVFRPVVQVSHVSIIPPMLHTHSVLYHRRCIMFFSQYFSLPCQYHSTNAPYSFIHLPPTVYDVFLPVLQFPMSVSFRQYSVPIHSTTTDAIWCFAPSTKLSPVSIITPMLHTHSFTYNRRYIRFFSQYSAFPC